MKRKLRLLDDQASPRGVIALTGQEERDLREFVAACEVSPPLVNVLREAVRVFLVQRARDPNAKKRYGDWPARYLKRFPRLVIVHDD